MKPQKRIIVIFLVSIFIICCRPTYLRVNATVNTKLIKDEFENTESKSYQRLRKTRKKIAISLPSDYYEILRTSDSREASEDHWILKEDYALGITEIEELLVENGIVVLLHQKYCEIMTCPPDIDPADEL